MTVKEKALYDKQTHTITCPHDFSLNQLPKLKMAFKDIHFPGQGMMIIDGEKIDKMDSAGAWLILEWEHQLERKGLEVKLAHFSSQHLNLLELIKKRYHKEKEPKKPKVLNGLDSIGKQAEGQAKSVLAYLAFIGYLGMEVLRLGFKPQHFRFKELVGIIYRTGFQALPIIALLSFMIGVVVAYQMGIQLKSYGANIYIVDLLGISMLREFGPLLTAIMVSGRTGSAFTAQLGIMKINQEIDALNTMGVTPADLLIIPRIIGLFIVLPLLAMWANIFGVIGGMIMANSMLNITWYDFVHRFPSVVPLKALLTGLGKTPVFALIIASIGCFQGIKVTGSAESVGQNTTRSVVWAIFFIIVADAAFSVIFSKLKL